MIKWIVQKVIIGKINDFLDTYKDNIANSKKTLELWISRLEKILAAFKTILAKLDDGKLDEEEIDQIAETVQKTIKEF